MGVIAIAAVTLVAFLAFSTTKATESTCLKSHTEQVRVGTERRNGEEVGIYLDHEVCDSSVHLGRE